MMEWKIARIIQGPIFYAYIFSIFGISVQVSSSPFRIFKNIFKSFDNIICQANSYAKQRRQVLTEKLLCNFNDNLLIYVYQNVCNCVINAMECIYFLQQKPFKVYGSTTTSKLIYNIQDKMCCHDFYTIPYHHTTVFRIQDTSHLFKV